MLEQIDSIAAQTTPQAVVNHVAAQVAGRDIAYFSHRTLMPEGQLRSVSTVPLSWRAHYASENYAAVDPGLPMMQGRQTPFIMSFESRHPTYHAKGRMETVYEEMKSFEARGTFFVPFPGEGRRNSASVNFLTDLGAKDFDEWLAVNGPSLSLLATLSHAKIQQLTAKPTPEVENPLAPREQECLCWLAQGLKTDRIAERMDVSPRTVEFHLKNARKKLGAKTREQALAKAILSGFLNL